jgi:hypothetical protein
MVETQVFYKLIGLERLEKKTVFFVDAGNMTWEQVQKVVKAKKAELDEIELEVQQIHQGRS